MKALAHFVRRKGRRGRRGTVLILALGVLAILSIAALSYVTVVRLERSNVAVAVRGGDYQAKVKQVVDHVGDLLAADLFGNKIVTSEVDFEAPGTTARIWPGMFEDGDYRDALTFESSTFNTSNDPANPSADAVLDLATGERALPDDAFLAAIEPKWDRSSLPTSLLDTTTWHQISNPRSAYTYDDRGTPGNVNDDRWVRGDGRFVDLASWFYATTSLGYADPSVSLVDWSDPRVRQIGPDAGVADANNNEFDLTQLSADTDFFGFQMNSMSGSILPGDNFGPPLPSDERQWVDTDGDLRPDSRWTVLDQMNLVGGLKWVVAMRIVDASALVNVNASIEFGGAFGYPADAALLGDGRTPADIDLPRLLESMSRPPNLPYYANEVRTDRLFPGGASYNRHLLDGLGVGYVIDDSPLNGAPPPTGIGAFTDWQPGAPSTPQQRTEFWRLFGQNALQPGVEGRRGGGYPVRELVDLAAFHGTNNSSIVSRIEQAFDGTEALGYLPNDTMNIYGPMRSKENAASIRRWIQDMEDFDTQALPTAIQIHDSARRFLTPISGVGLQSPVPALNPALKTQLSTDKVDIYEPLDPEDVRDAFQALVWALAPLATSQPLAQGVVAGLESEDAHYGGYNFPDGGPGYRALARTLYPPNAFSITQPNASFAVLTAASLAVNTADAVDAPSGGVTGDPPTVAVLYNSFAPPQPAAFGAIPLGTRLAQGDILPTALPWVDTTGANPYLLVGLERQPFLREVAVIAVYSDSTFDVGVGNDDSITGPLHPTEGLGSAVRFVLHNPWSTPLSLGPEYNLVIPEMPNDGTVLPDYIDDPTTTGAEQVPFRISLPAFVILPGESMGFVWILDAQSDSWDDIRAEILAKADFATCHLLPGNSVTPDPVAINNRVPFTNAVANPGARGVLLTYLDSTPGSMLPELVLDRMMPSGSVGFPEFKSTTFDFRNTASAQLAEQVDNVPGGFSPGPFYFQNLGWDPIELQSDPRWSGAATLLTGRLIQTACISRPTGRRQNGMSATVIEDPSKNSLTQRQEAVAWFVQPGTTYLDDMLKTRRDSVVIDVTGTTGIDFPNLHVRAFGQTNRTFADDANPYGVGDADLPVFQLFVPNDGLVTSADMLRVGIFAHTCKDCGTLTEVGDLGKWRTVSEKLGFTLENDNAGTGLGNLPNPYFGVLDPTRYVLGSDLQAGNALNTMKIPLALRVPDCFEASDVRTNLVQGRVNLNTAPREVLTALPLVAPLYNIDIPTGSSDGTLAVHDPLLTNRVKLIEDYRDPTLGAQALPDIASANLPQGLRANPTTPEADSGFATAAELAVLGQWNNNGTELDGTVFANQPGTFLELGADILPNDFSPLQLQEDHDSTWAYNTDPMATVLEAKAVYPIDDPEERLALYRAISNIATARSDVFIAWFVIRGYDPQTIEQIDMNDFAANPAAPTDQNVIAAMDNPATPFVPTHESRWLVVFDRSQTESGDPLDQPTERPRVLMKVQLPSAKP